MRTNMDTVYLNGHNPEFGSPQATVLDAPTSEVKSFFGRFVEILFTPFKWLTDLILQPNNAKTKPLSDFEIHKVDAKSGFTAYTKRNIV